MQDKEPPLISIILPTYNRQDYLTIAIKSCLEQTYKNFELIVVDDCSSDSTEQIVAEFIKQDQRIQYIRNATNQKLPASLNIGFSKAQGKYYSWTSDDNFYHPEAIKQMLAILESNDNIGLVYADYYLINQQGNILCRLHQEEPEFLPIRCCVGACFLYRASVALQIGTYNTNFFLNEDYEYWLRMGLVTKMQRLPNALYFYRRHEGTLSNKRREEIRLGKLKLKTMYFHRYTISDHLKPIADLYSCFIADTFYKKYLTFIWTICKSPIITLSYIIKQFQRFIY